ncbi:MBL fold metallo-hydrolase [Ferrimonas pelagia]
MQLHVIEGYIQSLYLVEYDHGLLLLDGGCRSDVGTVLRFINTELGRPIGDLTLVVVTHMHPDHAGAATRLRQLTGCGIATGEAGGHWYDGLEGRLMHLTDLLLARWVAHRLKRAHRRLWYPAILKADHYLADGQPLPGFSQWQALSTQGHTDRDISVWHPDSGRVYVADLMVKVKGRFIPPFPVFHPNRYRRSVERIGALQPRHVLLAHGGEVQLTEADYQYLQSKAPRCPQTHWRAVKARFQRVWTGS